MIICAVIPCYNEVKAIGDIVARTLKYVDRVVVVDNMSMDGTAAEASKYGAEVIKCNKKGYGAAVSAGISHVLDMADIIVTLDGDGQHEPEEIAYLIAPLISDKSDIVIGSRFMEYSKAPLGRRIGQKIINVMCNTASGKRWVCDTQSCFRAYTRRALVDIRIEERGFSASTEILIKARKLGHRILETPISCIYHWEFGANSTLNPLKHGFEVAWKTIKWRIKCRS